MIKNELKTSKNSANKMLDMVFRFYVNSGEHQFFIKRLKNLAASITVEKEQANNSQKEN